MQIKEEVLIKATPSKIFNKYRNVESWRDWDPDVKESSLSGEFKEGTLGLLIPTKGPKAKFKLTEVSLNKSFTSQTKLPLCILEFTHLLEEQGEFTKVTHSVSFYGLTSFIFGRLIGKQIKKSLPKALNGLKSACE